MIPQAHDVTYLPLAVSDYHLTNSLKQMPKLLRSYLSMNGWVGDAIVVDQVMNTMHVFTRLDVGAVPEARANLLRNTKTD